MIKQLWNFKHCDKDGNVIDEWSQYNALADEGEEAMLDVFYRAATAPTTFYCRLFNDTPAETDAISDLTGEASGGGYAAEEIERSATGFPTLALDSGDFQLTSKTVTFTATTGFGPVTYACLTTSTDSSGLLIAYVALTYERTLAASETLQVTIDIKQQ